ncbi:Rossmann-like domain-containing protein [Lentzea sp. E54]|uniref:Rossmann-like domain-containing protein n=1 Tax=Lentzea xerophila TaxID=3435883 RepID=UPI003DA58D57
MTLTELVELVRGAGLGPDPATCSVSVGFTTRQGAQHATRGQSYRNTVVSLRVEEAVGSCAVEDIADDEVHSCVGTTVLELLDHANPAIRTAALDAYLAHVRPHHLSATKSITIGPGSSLTKSMARAHAVVSLLAPAPGDRVLVVGVVNSLLHHLRERGATYVPCDLKGGQTEWDEPITSDAEAALDECDLVLASGMTVGNGTFGPLLAHAAEAGKPVVLFAQTAGAILPWFIGSGVRAVSAEPYPFFWLDGGPTTIHHYTERPS